MVLRLRRGEATVDMTTNSIRSTHLPLVLAMTLAAAVGTAPTFAHEEGQRAAGSTNPAQQVTDGGVNADVAAAVATVERFSTALSAGEIDRAVAELDPKPGECCVAFSKTKNR